ncbi:hypothetical protein CcCBS67573_g07284 [Chytriomyces confervae]|uniref:RING-type domain-containing protein n=1 Tax=Chytriomyces confervae TaxID=246404 RepID=A0A507EW78_9FUNG|nr:hypothetical protein CcCBS67573_g07284 [Chytriomyces confervae]
MFSAMQAIPEIQVDDSLVLSAAPAAGSAIPRSMMGEDQNVKGGHALRTLKKYCEELYTVNAAYKAQIETHGKELSKVEAEKIRLEFELQERNEKIAILRRVELMDVRSLNSRAEVEQLLSDETKKRIKLEAVILKLKDELVSAKAVEESLRAQVHGTTTVKSEHEVSITFYKKRITELEKVLKHDIFEIDELRVQLVKHTRKSDELEKAMMQMSQKNEFLTHAEATFREENTALQKRLRELIDANKEVTANYQAIKKNHDLKRSEFEELVAELEEAKSACQLAIKQKKTMNFDLNNVIKQRQELTDKNKALDNLLARKEKDIADLLTKVNDTINEYELKLERKEEQMWAMSLQMSEESQKNRTSNHLNIDPDFINDIEKKWQAKEKALQNEIERQANNLRGKDEQITDLSATVAELQKKQFQPRMERLKAIEKDIKGRMEEYALAEERMETGFLCPRDLQCFKIPMTLIPCGHTYCKHCVESLKEENYNVLKCQVCNVPVQNVFRNEQLENVGEQFTRRKTLTLSFLEWIKMLKVYLPEN